VSLILGRITRLWPSINAEPGIGPSAAMRREGLSPESGDHTVVTDAISTLPLPVSLGFSLSSPISLIVLATPPL